MDHLEYLTQRKTDNESIRDELFQKAKALENEDRECFSRAREGWEVVGREDLSQHPHKSLIPLWGAGVENCFNIDPASPMDGEQKQRVFALNRKVRTELAEKPSIVPDVDEFKSTFESIFCEGK
jgi:hypothetical protein